MVENPNQGRLPKGRLALAALATLAALVVSHIAFVALYSFVMNPGKEEAYYQKFARMTGAPFATVLGVFVVFLLTRWVLQRSSASARLTAAALVLSIMVLNAIVLAAIGEAAEILKLPHLLGETGKCVGALLAAATVREGR